MADIARDIDILFLLSGMRPSLKQCSISLHNYILQSADCFIVERRLNHLPLSLPQLSFTHHQAIAEQQTNPFKGQTLPIVLPVFSEYVI
jgi:hypothetical protein